jgi:hypothetical protein
MGDQLWTGPGGTEAQPTPQLVAGGLQFAELVAGGNHACGILLNGTAACFGEECQRRANLHVPLLWDMAGARQEMCCACGRRSSCCHGWAALLLLLRCPQLRCQL